MNIRLHKQARTTPAIRREIQESSLSERALAEKYSISRATVRKWKQRQSVEDQSNRPHAVHSALSPIEELFAIGLRRCLLLPLDDLLLVMRVFFHANVSRSALDRCLRRHSISRLSPLSNQGENRGRKICGPGEVALVYIDLSPLLKASQQRLLYMGVDQASRWLYGEIRPAHSSTTFLQNLFHLAPFKVTAVHTASNSEYIISTPESQQHALDAEKQHPFTQLCSQSNLHHHLHDHFGEMLPTQEIGNLVAAYKEQGTLWAVSEAREMLAEFCTFYNDELPLKTLHDRTPSEMINDWLRHRDSGNVQSSLTNSVTIIQKGESPDSRHLSEKEELHRLRDKNRRLRLEQELLTKRRANAFVKDEKSHNHRER